MLCIQTCPANTSTFIFIWRSEQLPAFPSSFSVMVTVHYLMLQTHNLLPLLPGHSYGESIFQVYSYFFCRACGITFTILYSHCRYSPWKNILTFVSASKLQLQINFHHILSKKNHQTTKPNKKIPHAHQKKTQKNQPLNNRGHHPHAAAHSEGTFS